MCSAAASASQLESVQGWPYLVGFAANMYGSSRSPPDLSLWKGTSSSLAHEQFTTPTPYRAMSSRSSLDTVRVAAGLRMIPPQCSRMVRRCAMPKRQSLLPVSRRVSFWFISHMPRRTDSSPPAPSSEPPPLDASLLLPSSSVRREGAALSSAAP